MIVYALIFVQLISAVHACENLQPKTDIERIQEARMIIFGRIKSQVSRAGPTDGATLDRIITTVDLEVICALRQDVNSSDALSQLDTTLIQFQTTFIFSQHCAELDEMGKINGMSHTCTPFDTII